MLRCDAPPNGAHEDDDYHSLHLASWQISLSDGDGNGDGCFIYCLSMETMAPSDQSPSSEETRTITVLCHPPIERVIERSIQ